jgi:hypothetical protein
MQQPIACALLLFALSFASLRGRIAFTAEGEIGPRMDANSREWESGRRENTCLTKSPAGYILMP